MPKSSGRWVGSSASSFRSRIRRAELGGLPSPSSPISLLFGGCFLASFLRTRTERFLCSAKVAKTTASKNMIRYEVSLRGPWPANNCRSSSLPPLAALCLRSFYADASLQALQL